MMLFSDGHRWGTRAVQEPVSNAFGGKRDGTTGTDADGRGSGGDGPAGAVTDSSLRQVTIRLSCQPECKHVERMSALPQCWRSRFLAGPGRADRALRRRKFGPSRRLSTSRRLQGDDDCLSNCSGEPKVGKHHQVFE